MAHGEALDDISGHIHSSTPTAAQHQPQQQPSTSDHGHQVAPSTQFGETDDPLLVAPVHPFLQNEYASLICDNIVAIIQDVTCHLS